MSSRRWIATGGIGAAIAVAAGVSLVVGSGDGAAAAGDTGAVVTATTTIERRDLVETENVDGTLGYSDGRAVTNRLDGTITWLPAAGSLVETNHRLYEVDGNAVYLLDGPTPAWRTLKSGTSGRDVRELERNLRDLGLDPGHSMDVDGAWDSGTTAAVDRWQRHKGFDETGQIELGRVVFQPGKRRIATTSSTLGASAAQGAASATGGGGSSATSTDSATGTATANALLTTTSVKKIVTIKLKTSKVGLARVGSTVSVELPSGDGVKARIASVGSVATPATGDNASASDATVNVTLRLRGSLGTSGLDQAPVTVRLERSRRKDVLAVPVTALQARSGGGFAVELRGSGQRRAVRVRVGLYASGYVEISGSGLREGQSVSNAAV